MFLNLVGVDHSDLFTKFSALARQNIDQEGQQKERCLSLVFFFFLFFQKC